MKYQFNDGGREKAGFKGTTGDCVVRSIAIATEKPYQEVYDAVFEAGVTYGDSKRDKFARHIRKKGASPRDGVHKAVTRAYLTGIGWKWTPTMFIGQGCKVHLKAEELPSGRLVVSVSKHLVAVIDGVINDTYDCSRGETRCVYGYWQKVT